MSQTQVATASQPAEPSREIQPTTAPIQVLSSPAAQALSNVRPLILSAYFYLRFGALVADPVSTLLADLIPVVVVQSVYAFICLPLSKRSAAIDQAKTNAPTKSKSGRAKASKTSQNDADVGTKISNVLLSLLLTIIATLPVFVLFVLFGAPLTTHHAHTLLCAAHFSLLGVLPLFYSHGVDRQAWWEIGGVMLPFDDVWGTTVGSALGAWLGAIPIPLDWDREWQKWPVTIVAGMYAGALVGNLAGRYIFFGKRIRFRPDEEEDKKVWQKTS